MEDVASRYLRTKALALGLSSLVEMIPTHERRMLLQEVYESYGTSVKRRKSRLCESIMSVLSSAEFPVKFADRASAKYSLRTTRLREYIRGRNCRPRDDLLWASLLVALDQDDPSGSQGLRERISALTQRLEQRLARTKDLLQSDSLAEATDEDLAWILEKLSLRMVDEMEMAQVLVKYKKVQLPDPRLSEGGRHKILNMIEARLNSARFRDSSLRSKLVRELVLNLVEVRLIAKTKIRQENLLRCATAAFQEVKGHGSSSEIIENYAARVARLVKSRTNVRVNSHAEAAIDYAIESVLRSA